MDIINDILTGVHKADGAYVTIPDRKEAIRYCMEHGQEGDVIILACKGPRGLSGDPRGQTPHG